MNKSEIRQTIDQYLNHLSPERLNTVVDFLAYLAEKESEDATQELLEFTGVLESFLPRKKDITEGRVTSWEQLKRKY